MSLDRCLVYSCGGNGREIAWMIQDSVLAGNPGAIRFIDDDASLIGTVINGIPVVGFDEAVRDYHEWPILVAIGNPWVREKVTRRCLDAGLRLGTAISGLAMTSRFNSYKPGVIVCAGSTVTVNVTLEEGVIVNRNCNVGHDTIVARYTSLAPGANVAGWVRIGRNVYIGSGASLIAGTKAVPLCIGDGATVGAGAVVVGNIPAGVTAVGVPARPITRTG